MTEEYYHVRGGCAAVAGLSEKLRDCVVRAGLAGTAACESRVARERERERERESGDAAVLQRVNRAGEGGRGVR